MLPEIKNIETLINLGSDRTILSHEITGLTALGENIGSQMLRVDLKVKTQKGTETTYVVAKLVPPNDFIQAIFNTQVTFRNEIAFYNRIIPTLQNFQLEKGIDKVIDFAPRYYASRINLNDDSTKRVDSDAALVLENLKILNYTTIDRTKGLDLDAARLVLKNLAYFHAVPLALKLQKPREFEEKIKPHLAPWQMKADQFPTIRQNLNLLFENVPELEPLKEKIFTGLDLILTERETREPFATMTHNDCWNNNNMFKIEGGTVVGSKLVDYQLCGYGSPARDVVFFLYSSVKVPVLKQHCDTLVKEYYQNFVTILEELKCDCSGFSFEAFLKEMDFEAKYSQFGHLVFMLFPIYSPREESKELSEITPENMARLTISEEHKEIFKFFINDFVEKGWI